MQTDHDRLAPDAQIEAERLLLAALVQGSLPEDIRDGVWQQLAKTRFAATEHEIVFQALLKLPLEKPERVREALAGAVTRLGFPDLDLNPLFETDGPDESDLPRLLGNLQPNRATGATGVRSDASSGRIAGSENGAGSASAAGDWRGRFLKAAPDVLGVPLVIAWIIWRGPSVAAYLVPVLLVWIGASFLLHGDTRKTLGLRVDNLRAAIGPAVAVLGSFAVMLVIFGFVLRRIFPYDFSPLDPVFDWQRLAAYSGSALIQQVGVNSLETNRLLSLTSRRWLAALVSGLIFCTMHWPNPVLVPLTLIAGTATAWLFARERNLIPLVIGHAVLGLLLWWTFPFSWHHGMRVGRGYYHYVYSPKIKTATGAALKI